MGGAAGTGREPRAHFAVQMCCVIFSCVPSGEDEASGATELPHADEAGGGETTDAKALTISE